MLFSFQVSDLSFSPKFGENDKSPSVAVVAPYRLFFLSILNGAGVGRMTTCTTGSTTMALTLPGWMRRGITRWPDIRVRSKIRIESKFWTLEDKGRDTYIICLASICDTLLFVSLFVAHIYRATFQICLGWTEQPDLCAFITGVTGKVYHSSCSLRKGGCVTSTHETANMEKKKVFLRSFKSSKM